VEVSADRVVWTAFLGVSPTYAYDVPRDKISRLPNPVEGDKAGVVDAYGTSSLYESGGSRRSVGHLVLDVTGRGQQDFSMVEPRARFSPSGKFVLSNGVVDSETTGTPAVIDTTTGSVWLVPRVGGSWVAWSYGDIALLNPTTDSESRNIHRLLACDAARQTCKEMPVEGAVLMPTS
jgi:hypothetical protein